MDKVVNKTLKLGYYYYSLVKICGILWLAKQIRFLNLDASLVVEALNLLVGAGKVRRGEV